MLYISCNSLSYNWYSIFPLNLQLFFINSPHHIRAQRKFAHGSRPDSPCATPISTSGKKFDTQLLVRRNLFPKRTVNTDDFLTFLCFRGTHNFVFAVIIIIVSLQAEVWLHHTTSFTLHFALFIYYSLLKPLRLIQYAHFMEVQLSLPLI